MNMLEKYQTISIFSAIVIGLLLGQFTVVEAYAGHFIVPFLFFMLYGLFLVIPLARLKHAFKNMRFLGTGAIINFIWSPILAWGLGALFLADHPTLWIGFIMLMVTPCTDWYLMFTAIAKGNTALSTTILPVNLILQMLLLPVYLYIFAGAIQPVPLSIIGQSMVVVLVLPFVLAHLTRYALRKKAHLLSDRLIPFFTNAQMIFLSLAIMAMFASQGNHLLDNLEIIYILLIPILLFFFINFMLAQVVGRRMKFSYEDTASLSLTIIARNSPVALAITVTAFPDQPLIALALVIGPLIELPVLMIVSKVLLLLRINRVGRV
ncbi:arsenic resistance protein [Salinicoccus siamensis]|uniref:Arsenic resistance protein n=1 Tax=Salinicoccus siamensis TaxID=381830 RepID=A0ABV5Z701_9STAP